MHKTCFFFILIILLLLLSTTEDRPQNATRQKGIDTVHGS